MKAMTAWLAIGVMLLACNVALALSDADEADWNYRVQPGDTLSTLAEAWLAPGRTWRDLHKLNRLPASLLLKPGSTLRMPLAWLKREASVAEAVFTRGQVTRQRDGGSQALAAGERLQSGDRIHTGAQSSASLRFADGSRLLIPPDSQVTLDQLLTLGRGALPAVRISVQQGGADSRVMPNAQRLPLYEVRTPHVNLGVRGTEFRVQTTAEGSRVQVLSGAVRAVGLGTVAANQGLLADGPVRSLAPLLPAPDLSGLTPVIERLPLRLAWLTGPSGAVAWRAQLYPRGDFDRLLLDVRVAEAAATWPQARELVDGDYTLRLRAIDARGLEGAAADADVRLQARPEPPFIQAPPPDAVIHSSAGAARLTWTRNTDASLVRLQVARDAAFRDLVVDTPPLDDNGIQLDLPHGDYHWRIASVEPGGRAGPFSDTQRFSLVPPPPAPPPAEPELSGDQLKLRWRADARVTRYELDWSRTETFDGADVQRLATDTPEIALPKPPPGRYFLRARAFNAAGVASPWGQTQMIEQPYPRWLWLLPLLLVPLL